MKSGNPALTAKTFLGLEATTEDVMTLPGTINKTAILLAIALAAAVWVWGARASGQDVMPYLLAGSVGGLIFALVTIFMKKTSGYTAPIYAALEGLALGAISFIYEAKYPGVAIQAVGLTFGVMICMLALYKFKVIEPTEKFKIGVISATGAIAILYLVDVGMMFFGHPIPFIHEGGFMGIAFSLFVIGIAALNLILDFGFISQGVALRAPKYMEWYSAFSLVVTLVWLYLEILRLLGKRR